MLEDDETITDVDAKVKRNKIYVIINLKSLNFLLFVHLGAKKEF